MTAKHHTTGAGILLAGLMAATGCAGEQEALIVLHSPLWTGPDCLVEPTNDTAYAQGTLDVAFGTPYLMPVILQNQLLSQSPMTSNNGIDNGEMQLAGADVTLRMPQAPEVLDAVAAENGAFTEFSIDLASISLAASERQGFLVEVISQGASEAFAREIAGQLDEDSQPTVLADTVFRALRTGNKVGGVGEVETRTYTFPIRLCLNCLGTCSSCVDGQCPQDDLGGFSGGICGNAQDLPVAPPVCPNPNME
ncbi:MAG: hypothetical protein AAF721_40120 [Myxococcota bacterium]